MIQRLRMAISHIAHTDLRSAIQLSPLHKSLLPVLALASILYRSLLFLRQQLYQWRIFTPVRLPVAVISVGNVSWGGNGKTPMVEYLARHFLQYNIRPLILTRGYGGGDEVRLLEGHLHGSGSLIGVGPNRVEVAMRLLAKHGVGSVYDRSAFTKQYRLLKELFGLQPHSEEVKPGMALEDSLPFQIGTTEYKSAIGVILLDDGMQHWRISRDVEIVMVNAISLFGNEMLIPYGPLREPLDGLRRADILVIHHACLVPDQRLQTVKERLTSLLQPKTLVVCSKMVPQVLIRALCVPVNLQDILGDGKEKNSDLFVELDVIRNSYVLCVSGVGCPESLSLVLEQLGAKCVLRMDFPDHHHFLAKDFWMIQRRLSALSSDLKHLPLVIVTEKDYARNPEFFGKLKDCNALILHSTIEIINDSGDVSNFNSVIADKIERFQSLKF